MFEIRQYPEFSWSNSRHRTFMECKKKYYYHYYLSHNGWLFQAAEENKLAYRLKNIKNLPIALGEVIHDIIHSQLKAYLAGETLASEQELIQQVKDRLNLAFIHSKKHVDDWMMKPKKFQMLHEIYYYNKLEQSDVENIKQKIDVCIKNLLSSKSYNTIITDENIHVIEAEELKTVYFDGVKVYVVLDFLYRERESDKWIIVDWKTGKQNKTDRDQLALYVLYLIDKYKITLDNIIIRNEYLQSGETKDYTLCEDDLIEARNLISDSTEAMRRFLAQPSINKPLAEDEYEETFSYRCNSCNFKQLCDGKREE
ncbi:PD-(D/E)XK nuclease family protein [Anaerobacillus sp. MEB173]|uniref:PD-(D/E)XK nuclease family protein n=1 Tax=Anaerobacillus sp. MEB173 TaxID=3383345 RepID=UPI003F8EE54F